MIEKTLNKHRDTFICMMLVLVTLAVFLQVRTHEFVAFDDGKYVSDNRYVQAGLTRQSIGWAFTTGHASNWHPVTWLSHMLDCQLFGLNPGAHHLTSLLLHMVNTVLLFLVLRHMTGVSWRSGFVAALFALHPLHVESVVWIAERKDVLSTLFWMFTVSAYVRYVEKPAIWRYLLTVLLFVLGLMAKPMLVTLPFVLLLLDYWPLGRLSDRVTCGNGKARGYWRLVYEKTPLFMLATASCVVTLLVQRHGGAVAHAAALPLRFRFGNAVLAYATYIGKMFWPRRLAVLYPHLGDKIPVWQVAVAAAILIAVSSLVWRSRRRYPYLLTGWLWYIGTLVPVIGIVQVGDQALADRYTYVPLVGLFVMVVWGIADLVERRRGRQVGLAVSAAGVLCIMIACTWRQVNYWQNSITLYEHTLRVTSDNAVIHNNLGSVMFDQGDIQSAIHHFTEAVTIAPDNVRAHSNLGNALLEQGKTAEAVAHLSKALSVDPRDVGALYNMGNAMAKQDKFDEAAVYYSEAIRIKPDYLDAHNNLGIVLARQGKTMQAIDHFSIILRSDPDNVPALSNMGYALFEQGNLDAARTQFLEVLRIDPSHVGARTYLDRIETEEAAESIINVP